MSLNRVAISGNLTRDPDLRLTQGGMPVLSIGVAVNDRRRNSQTGEWEDQPNFVDCVIFGQRANSLASMLAKGTKVAIEGKLRQSRWQDKQTGQNRSKLEVVVDDIDLMQARGEGQGGRQTESQPAPRQPQAYQPAPEPNYQQGRLVGSDDIPF